MACGKLANVAAKLNEEQQCNVYLPWGNEAEKRVPNKLQTDCLLPLYATK